MRTIEEIETKFIKVEEIKASVFNRTVIDQKEIQQLADSIIRDGQQSPIKVMLLDDGSYKLLYGSQRLEAVKFAKIPEIRADIVKSPMTESSQMIVSAIENGQRQNLNPYDEARQIQKLIELNLKKGDISKLKKRDFQAESAFREMSLEPATGATNTSRGRPLPPHSRRAEGLQ